MNSNDSIDQKEIDFCFLKDYFRNYTYIRTSPFMALVSLVKGKNVPIEIQKSIFISGQMALCSAYEDLAHWLYLCKELKNDSKVGFLKTIAQNKKFSNSKIETLLESGDYLTELGFNDLSVSYFENEAKKTEIIESLINDIDIIKKEQSQEKGFLDLYNSQKHGARLIFDFRNFSNLINGNAENIEMMVGAVVYAKDGNIEMKSVNVSNLNKILPKLNGIYVIITNILTILVKKYRPEWPMEEIRNGFPHPARDSKTPMSLSPIS